MISYAEEQALKKELFKVPENHHVYVMFTISVFEYNDKFYARNDEGHDVDYKEIDEELYYSMTDFAGVQAYKKSRTG